MRVKESNGNLVGYFFFNLITIEEIITKCFNSIIGSLNSSFYYCWYDNSNLFLDTKINRIL